MKKLRQSKTFWVNALIIAASLLTTLIEGGALTPQITAYLIAVVGIINILLRLVTKKPISLGK